MPVSDLVGSCKTTLLLILKPKTLCTDSGQRIQGFGLYAVCLETHEGATTFFEDVEGRIPASLSEPSGQDRESDLNSVYRVMPRIPAARDPRSCRPPRYAAGHSLLAPRAARAQILLRRDTEAFASD